MISLWQHNIIQNFYLVRNDRKDCIVILLVQLCNMKSDGNDIKNTRSRVFF